MDILSKDLIRLTLKSNICKVTFKKANGEIRDMICTLKEDVVVPHEKKTERVKSENNDVLAVWDCEKSAWRSFRYDSVISMSDKENVPA